MGISEWIKEFLVAFRTKINESDIQLRERFKLFSSPCQIRLMEVRINEKNLQIFIFQHNPELEDMYFKLYGPYLIQTNLDNIEKFLANSNNYEELKPVFVTIVKDPEFGKSGGFITSFPITNAFFLSWLGSIDRASIDYVIEKIFGRNQLKSEISGRSITTSENGSKGYGCYISKSIWIGDESKLSLEQELRDAPFREIILPVIHSKYKDHPVVLESDGFIAICEENLQAALSLLNEIMFAFVLKKRDIQSISEMQLGSVSFDKQGNLIEGGMRIGFYNTQLSRLRDLPVSIFSFLGRSIFSIENVLEILRMAERMNDTAEKTYRNLMYLECDTLYQNSKFAPSFLLSWAMVEQYLVQKWNITYSLSKGKRKIKSKQPGAAIMIRVLKKRKILTGKIAKKMKQYRQIRNSFLHKLSPIISYSLAFDCLNFVRNLYYPQY